MSEQAPQAHSKSGSCLGILAIGFMAAILILGGLIDISPFAMPLGLVLGLAAFVLGIMWIVKHGRMSTGV